MKADDTLLIHEFAQLAGVTVRTLHYYDKEGLLSPAQKTEAGHRLYRRSDLLRLQQILTLKAIGFSLNEIRALLQSPHYDIRTSLRLQKEAIDQRVAELQKVSRALQETLEIISTAGTDELDWALVTGIIQVVTKTPKEWMRSYFPSEKWEAIQERGRDVTLQQLAQWQREWDELAEAMRALLAQGRAPSDPEVQVQAAKYHALIETFTQGDAQILAGLRALSRDISERPPEQRPYVYEPELQCFMNEAMRIYRGE